MFTFSTRQLFVAQQKAVRYICLLWRATARGGTSRSHTSNIVPTWLAERARCPVLTSEYFFVSAGSSPRTNLVTKVVTLHQSRAQNLSNIWRSTFETVLVCKQKPYPIRYDFLGGAKGIRYSVKITLPKYVLRHVAKFKSSKEGSRWNRRRRARFLKQLFCNLHSYVSSLTIDCFSYISQHLKNLS